MIIYFALYTAWYEPVLISFCTDSLFLLQEHMILCRFADQTAVQLPPERRIIGKVDN